MKRVADLFLRLSGWTRSGRPPEAPSFVLIAAPHTSNWDLLFMLAFQFSYGMRVRWLGKHTLFRPPLGWLLGLLGGLPVDRRAPGGFVGQAVARFAAAPALVLVVPPEGTRGRAAHWKSGFYHIAREAGVPICLSFLDYGRRVGGFGPTLVTSADVASDMNRIRTFYRDVDGLHPERFTEPRLADEGPGATVD